MKPFYGIDRTTDKKNKTHLGDCFIAARVSAGQNTQLERAAEHMEDLQKKAGLPKALNWVRIGIGFLAAFLFAILIECLEDLTYIELYEAVPWMFWLLGAFAAVWGVLSLVHHSIKRNVMNTEEAKGTERRMEAVVNACALELGVPQNAKEVDIICFRHRIKKNGKLKGGERGMEYSPYSNEVFRVWKKDNTLYLATTDSRYEIPLSDLRHLRQQKRRISVTGWNKAEDMKEGFYKPYKLNADSYGRIHMKYGILELERNGERWGIWLPCYELNYLAALTGLTVAE